MSLHFYVDISTDLASPDELTVRALTSLAANEELRAEILEQLSEDVREFFSYAHFDDKLDYLPGGSSCTFKYTYRYTKPNENKDVHRWTLNYRKYFLDDELYETGYQFLQWLAPISTNPGFVGYIKEEFSDAPDLIYFRDGKMEIRYSEYGSKEKGAGHGA